MPYPDGQHLRLLSEDISDMLLLDIQACSETDCEWQVAPEEIVVSANGRQQLSQQGFNLIHDKQDGSPATTTSNAFAPFWLQEQFYGYLRPLPDSPADIQVYVRNTVNNETFPLFTTQDIRSKLPNNPETLIITAITPIANNINQITVQVYAPAQNQTYTFAFYRSTGILELLTTDEQTASQNPLEPPWQATMRGSHITLQPTNSTATYSLNAPVPACAYMAWLNE